MLTVLLFKTIMILTKIYIVLILLLDLDKTEIMCKDIKKAIMNMMINMKEDIPCLTIKKEDKNPIHMLIVLIKAI